MRAGVSEGQGIRFGIETSTERWIALHVQRRGRIRLVRHGSRLELHGVASTALQTCRMLPLRLQNTNARNDKPSKASSMGLCLSLHTEDARIRATERADQLHTGLLNHCIDHSHLHCLFWVQEVVSVHLCLHCFQIQPSAPSHDFPGYLHVPIRLPCLYVALICRSL